MRAVIGSKMRRHAEQLPALVSKVVVLDYDGAAKAAGEIFDEPQLARPVSGDELNGLLPERFFVLQDALRSGARRIVEAAAQRDSRSTGRLVRGSHQDLRFLPRCLSARRSLRPTDVPGGGRPENQDQRGAQPDAGLNKGQNAE